MSDYDADRFTSAARKPDTLDACFEGEGGGESAKSVQVLRLVCNNVSAPCQMAEKNKVTVTLAPLSLAAFSRLSDGRKVAYAVMIATV